MSNDSDWQRRNAARVTSMVAWNPVRSFLASAAYDAAYTAVSSDAVLSVIVTFSGPDGATGEGVAVHAAETSSATARPMAADRGLRSASRDLVEQELGRGRDGGCVVGGNVRLEAHVFVLRPGHPADELLLRYLHLRSIPSRPPRGCLAPAA